VGEPARELALSEPSEGNRRQREGEGRLLGEGLSEELRFEKVTRLLHISRYRGVLRLVPVPEGQRDAGQQKEKGQDSGQPGRNVRGRVGKDLLHRERSTRDGTTPL